MSSPAVATVWDPRDGPAPDARVVDAFRRYQSQAPMQMLARGVLAMMPSEETEARPRTVRNQATGAIHVDPDCWNGYWESLLEYCPDLDERCQAQLRHSDTLVHYSRRVMLVFPPGTPGMGTEWHKRQVLRSATAYGVVEYFEAAGENFTLQFTLGTAAAQYKTSAEEAGVGRATPFVCFVPQVDVSSTALRLGANVVLGVQFVQALFAVFDAVEVSAEPNANGGAEAFTIKFKNAHAARVCHHALHRSMAEVFHLNLSFTTFPDAQEKAPFALVHCQESE